MLQSYFNRPLFTLLALGFSSGVPFLLTLSTLSFWLSELGISKSLLGFLMITSVPYSLKFLWSPFLETLSLPFFTKKFGPYKSWGILSQILLIISIIALGNCNPEKNLSVCAVLALSISFLAATQDIIIDSFRLRLLASLETSNTLGPGSAMEAIGFRIGMLGSGAGTLYLASYYGWPTAYTISAFSVIIGIIAFASIPKNYSFPGNCNYTYQGASLNSPPTGAREKFTIYYKCWQNLLKKPYFFSLVGFIMCFKITDTVLNAMSNPFLFELGFSKIECAQISKLFGISLMMLGTIIGGLVINYLGLKKTMVVCALVQTVSCFMFIIQAQVGHNLSMLTATIGVESLCSGLGSTALIAYLSHFCKGTFTVSHFTLLYSLGSFSRVIISATAGWVADFAGWNVLFLITSTSFIPVIFLLLRAQEVTKQYNQSLIQP